MSKHTSGEWVVDESRHDGCINRLEPFRHIGMVSSYQSVKGDREENEANARLIAAAPDLLEALRQCVKWHKTVIGDTYFPIESVQLAIDKATTIQ